MWHPALLVLGGKVLTQQLHKFLHWLSCCEILTEKCTSQTYLARSEHVWKKHGPPHSFIHRPSSLVCLSPSISVCLACWLSSRSSACQQRLFSLTARQNSQLTQLTASCLQTGLHPLQSALYERPEGRWGRASAASNRCCQQCWSTAVCQLQSIRISLQMSSLTQPGWI